METRADRGKATPGPALVALFVKTLGKVVLMFDAVELVTAGPAQTELISTTLKSDDATKKTANIKKKIWPEYPAYEQL